MANTLVVDGVLREFVLHAPREHAGVRTLPLVLMFHGGGGTAKVAAQATGWNAKADREGFFVAYPQGLRRDPHKPAGFLRNPQFWNVGSGISHAERDGVDDVGFVRAMLAEIAATHPIDLSRVYLCGFSNGAAMALRAGVDLADRVAAVAAVAGHLWIQDRRPARPVPLIYISGSRDPLVPPDGGPITSPWGRNLICPPILDTVGLWSEWLGCPPSPRIDESSNGVRRRVFGPGDSGAEVEWLLVSDAGHVWPGGPAVLAERFTGPLTDKLDATSAIWSFFSRSRA